MQEKWIISGGSTHIKKVTDDDFKFLIKTLIGYPKDDINDPTVRMVLGLSFHFFVKFAGKEL